MAAAARSDEGPAPTPSPFDAVGRLVQSVDPHAVRCRIVWVTEDGEEGSIPVPLRDTALGEMEAAILAVLGRFRPGEWIGGKALAAECNTARGDGTFKRAIKTLKDANKIETHQKDGYRLKL